SAVVVPVRGEPHRVRDLLPVRRLDRAVGPVTAGNGCRWGRGGGCAVLAVLGERRTGPRPRHRPAVAGSGCALPGKAVVHSAALREVADAHFDALTPAAVDLGTTRGSDLGSVEQLVQGVRAAGLPPPEEQVHQVLGTGRALAQVPPDHGEQLLPGGG